MAMASSHHHHHHHHVLLLLLFALLLSRVELSTCHLLKGSISCLDCHNRHLDLSGIKVVVKCSQVKKLAVATTGKDGTFETELPSDTSTPSSSSSSSVNCLAKIMGGPRQLYTSRKDTVARTVKVPDESESYTISKPLKFYASLPSSSQNDNGNFGSSKTVDLPLPPEWGLAPPSYYFPFVPIIGIP